MTRFQTRLRCTACGHRYRRVEYAPDEESLAYTAAPACPKCAVPERVIGMDVAAGRAPAVGGSLAVRAVDETAKIVMEDHNLTDLRSDVREGENMVPKLPPRQQALADNFFAAPQRRRNPAGGIFSLPPAAVLKAAVGGRFMTPDTISAPSMIRDASHAPRVDVIAASDRQGRPVKTG